MPAGSQLKCAKTVVGFFGYLHSPRGGARGSEKCAFSSRARLKSGVGGRGLKIGGRHGAVVRLTGYERWVRGIRRFRARAQHMSVGGGCFLAVIRVKVVQFEWNKVLVCLVRVSRSS